MTHSSLPGQCTVQGHLLHTLQLLALLLSEAAVEDDTAILKYAAHIQLTHINLVPIKRGELREGWRSVIKVGLQDFWSFYEPFLKFYCSLHTHFSPKSKLVVMDQPKLIPKFQLWTQPDQTRPDWTMGYFTWIHPTYHPQSHKMHWCLISWMWKCLPTHASCPWICVHIKCLIFVDLTSSFIWGYIRVSSAIQNSRVNKKHFPLSFTSNHYSHLVLASWLLNNRLEGTWQKSTTYVEAG